MDPRPLDDKRGIQDSDLAGAGLRGLWLLLQRTPALGGVTCPCWGLAPPQPPAATTLAPLLSIWSWLRGGDTGEDRPCLFWQLRAEAMRRGAEAAPVGGTGTVCSRPAQSLTFVCRTCSRAQCH